MIWQDLMLDRWVDAETLRAEAASAFGVVPDTVAVVDTPEEILALKPMMRVVVERVRQHRDFPLQILVALHDEALASRLGGFERVLPVVQFDVLTSLRSIAYVHISNSIQTCAGYADFGCGKPGRGVRPAEHGPVDPVWKTASALWR